MSPVLEDLFLQIHAPNENFPVGNFEAGIRLNQALLKELAR